MTRAAIKNGLPPHRLMLAPDCGLGFLPLQVGFFRFICTFFLFFFFVVRKHIFRWNMISFQVAEKKLANMVEAAKQIRSELTLVSSQ